MADLLDDRASSELVFAATLASEDKILTADHSAISPLRALALYMDLRLSFRKYNILRNTMNTCTPNILPSYYVLKNTEKSAFAILHFYI